MTGVIDFLYASGQLFPVLFSGAVPVSELSPVRVPVSSLLLCLFLCLSVASLYAAEQDGQSWTLESQPSSNPPPHLHRSTKLIRTTRAWWSGSKSWVVHCQLVMSIVAWSLLLLFLATPCLVSGAEEVQHLRLENYVGDLFYDDPLHGNSIDMTEFSGDSTSVLFHDPFQEALMVKEVLFVPKTRSRLIKEPKEYSMETDSSVIGGERRPRHGPCSPWNRSNLTCQPWKLELHQSHAVANFSVQLAVEVDDFRGWEKSDTARNTQRSWHDAVLVPFNSYSGKSDSTCPPTTHVLNFTGDQKHLHLLLSPGFIPESLQMEEMGRVFGTSEGQSAAFILESLVCSSSEVEDHRGVVVDESNSTWNLQLETPLLDQVFSAPTEAHVPLPSLDFGRGKSGDQLVQDLAPAEVTEESPLVQQVIFEGFQRLTGTRKYLSAADLTNSPRQISIMSAQADKPKELDLLDVSAFVFLPVVAVCFWMLTFSNDPLLPPTRGCNGVSKSWSLDHIDPFFGLGLIRNVCNLIGVRALSTIVNSMAASLGLTLHSNAHTPAIAPPDLPHIRVKLSKSSASDPPKKVKSGQEKNHSGSLSNSKRRAGNSGKRISQGVLGTENYSSSPNGACLQSQQTGNTCSGSAFAGSPRKGTVVLQKTQFLSHPVQQQQQQSVCMMDKEKRRQRRKKGSSSSVNHDASSNPGGSSGGSSPRTPVSLVLPASPLSPFEVQSGHAHLGDPIPATLAQQQPKVTCRTETVARCRSGTGNDSVSSSSSTGTSESALVSEGNEHKSSSKSKLSMFSQWDRGMSPKQQHETARPSLSISASFPAYNAQRPETQQNLFVDPALEDSNIMLAMPTIAPSCRAPGAKITKKSLGPHKSHVIVPHNKISINKFAITEGGVCGLGNEDSNLYDIWGDHFGEVGRFTTQQHQNDFAQRAKTSGLNKFLVCRSSGSLFSNPVFESLETSISSEASTTTHDVSAIQVSPQQSSFAVYSEASSLGSVLSSEPVHPLQVAETGTFSQTTNKMDRRSTATTTTTNMPDSSKQWLRTDSILNGYIATPRIPAPYKPPMGWHTPDFMASSS